VAVAEYDGITTIHDIIAEDNKMTKRQMMNERYDVVTFMRLASEADFS
jgi:hypothetical protein